MKSEITEWTKSLGTPMSTKQSKRSSNSPEQLVEESYEVVSTLTKPRDKDVLIASTSPRTATIQTHADSSTTKLQSSEDDSSYCEEWTVTEAKRKQDGRTVKTIIDR